MTIDPKTRIPLGTVTLLDRIGVGGYGEVFKAELEPFEQHFAVKLFRPSPFHSDDAQLMDRFVHEAEHLMNLRHPNIIAIYGVGEHEGCPYILMEYFAGYDLTAARKVMPSPAPHKVLPLIRFAADALGYAHSKDIIHRDIKPSNLMTVTGDARVLDFGIAQVLDPEGERFTRAGATPVGDAFSAPELIDDGRLLDPRCDIYSLGACWYWLLTGTTPRGRSWEKALREVPDMTSEYEDVVLRTLEQSDRRYQTMADLAGDLEQLSSGGSPTLSGSWAVDDDSALLLAAVFEHTSLEDEPISAYRLEQRLAGTVTRFDIGLGLKILKQRELVKSVFVEDTFNGDWSGFRATKSGENWLDTNRDRARKLLAQADEATDKTTDHQLDDDDIPF